MNVSVRQACMNPEKKNVVYFIEIHEHCSVKIIRYKDNQSKIVKTREKLKHVFGFIFIFYKNISI